MPVEAGGTMKFFSGMLFGIALLLAGGAAVIYAGLFDTAATVPPGALERKIAQFALDRSVERRAPKTGSPLKADPEMLRGGLAHYRGMCVGCHGAPGVDPSEAGEGLNTPASDLTLGRVQKRTDGELFWLVQNGVRMTGMPAFGPTHKDEEIWKIVAFLRHLPALTPEEEKVLRQAGSSGD
jgi:mono/diheme cytochrome c family protein